NQRRTLVRNPYGCQHAEIAWSNFCPPAGGSGEPLRVGLERCGKGRQENGGANRCSNPRANPTATANSRLEPCTPLRKGSSINQWSVMRPWTWLLPCWVWKYFFAQLPREQARLDDRTRFLIRLDEEFALIYDPLPRGRMLAAAPGACRLPREAHTTQTTRI